MTLYPITLGGEVFHLPGWVEQRRQELFLAPFVAAWVEATWMDVEWPS